MTTVSSRIKCSSKPGRRRSPSCRSIVSPSASTMTANSPPKPRSSTCAAGKNSRGSSSAAISPPRPGKPGCSPTSKASAPSACCWSDSAPRPLARTTHAQEPGAAAVLTRHQRRHAHAHHLAGAGPAASRSQGPVRRTPGPRRGRAHRQHAVPGQRSQERQEAARPCADARGGGRAGQGRAGRQKGIRAGRGARRRCRAHAQPRQSARQCLHAHLPRQDRRRPGQDPQVAAR